MFDLPDKEKFADQIRIVTPDEAQFFRENGWVKLEGLMTRELAEELCDHLKAVVAARTEGPDEYVSNLAPGVDDDNVKAYVASTNLRESDPFIWALACSRPLGEAAAMMLGTRPLRLFSDAVFHKAAMKPDGTGSTATPWHQDFPPVPIDRAIFGQIWVAAAEVLPEMGSLQYLTGSHREPPLGKAEAMPDAPNGATDVYPWLLEKYEVSPAFHLQPGDALAHHCLTMHSATPNTSTTADRWAWASQRFDAKAAYDGRANHRTDTRGLTVNKPFDHPAFPIVVD
jgi:Phytanoyl-CoA dioxygenase (PhyH)